VSWKWILAAVLLVGAFGALALLRGRDADEEASRINLESGVVHFGAIEVPIAQVEPLMGVPDIYVGIPTSPPPEFDTSLLGPDMTFVMGNPSRADLEVLKRRGNSFFGAGSIAVYLGDDSQGEPVYLFQVQPTNWFDHLKDALFGTKTTSVYGSSYGCCQQSTGEVASNQSDFGGESADGETWTYTAAMWSVSDDVSVVAFARDGETIGWQRPMSGFVGIQFQHSGSNPFHDLDVQMTAYTAAGDVIPGASRSH
jgi:hypothetical protein